MQLPLMQKYATRTIIGRFASSGRVVENLPKRAKRALRYAPKVKNSLPISCTTRERGARESRRLRCLERAPSRELAHTKRTSAYADRAAGRQASVQPLKAKRNPVALREVNVRSAVVPTDCRSPDACLPVPTARRNASR